MSLNTAFLILDYAIYIESNPSPALSYSTIPSYDATVQCEDRGGDTDTKILTISVTANTPPSFFNLPGKTSLFSLYVEVLYPKRPVSS